ncbi:hypothetical protein ACKI2N_010120 [Cupriavidus sp. 30B13]|uniref:hypothetical protein n=1 Tax=Cupriavidus sp. 30B13 TaxID=3384241 RepID=UPI003B8F6F26
MHHADKQASSNVANHHEDRLQLNALQSITPKVAAPDVAPQATPATTTARISNAGRTGAALDSRAQAKDIDNPELRTNLPLRELMSRYDFNRITPRQMAYLATELYSRGEISEDATSSFIGIDISTVEGMDLDEPIDMVAFAKSRLDCTEKDVRTGSKPYLAWTLYFYRESSQTLADMVSFADSAREHIASGKTGGFRATA